MIKRAAILISLFVLTAVLTSCGQISFDELCADDRICLEYSKDSVFLSDVYDFPDSVMEAARNAPADRIISPSSGTEVKSAQEAAKIARRHMLRKYDFAFDNYGIEIRKNESAWWVRYTTSYDYSVLRVSIGALICRATGEVLRAYP